MLLWIVGFGICLASWSLEIREFGLRGEKSIVCKLVESFSTLDDKGD